MLAQCRVTDRTVRVQQAWKSDVYCSRGQRRKCVLLSAMNGHVGPWKRNPSPSSTSVLDDARPLPDEWMSNQLTHLKQACDVSSLWVHRRLTPDHKLPASLVLRNGGKCASFSNRIWRAGSTHFSLESKACLHDMDAHTYEIPRLKEVRECPVSRWPQGYIVRFFLEKGRLREEIECSGEIWANVNIEALRANNEGEVIAAPECNVGGNRRSSRRPADSGIVRHDSHLRKERRSINDIYHETLTQLTNSSRWKRSGLFTAGVVLHDNARPSRAVAAVHHIAAFVLERLDHAHAVLTSTPALRTLWRLVFQHKHCNDATLSVAHVQRPQTCVVKSKQLQAAERRTVPTIHFGVSYACEGSLNMFDRQRRVVVELLLEQQVALLNSFRKGLHHISLRIQKQGHPLPRGEGPGEPLSGRGRGERTREEMSHLCRVKVVVKLTWQQTARTFHDAPHCTRSPASPTVQKITLCEKTLSIQGHGTKHQSACSEMCPPPLQHRVHFQWGCHFESHVPYYRSNIAKTCLVATSPPPMKSSFSDDCTVREGCCTTPAVNSRPSNPHSLAPLKNAFPENAQSMQPQSSSLHLRVLPWRGTDICFKAKDPRAPTTHVEIVPDDAAVRRVFSGSPVSPVLSFRRCSLRTSITLIGSQDLAGFWRGGGGEKTATVVRGSRPAAFLPHNVASLVATTRSAEFAPDSTTLKAAHDKLPLGIDEYVTDQNRGSGNSSESYSGGSGFDSRPGHPDFDFQWFTGEWVLNKGQGPFLPQSLFPELPATSLMTPLLTRRQAHCPPARQLCSHISMLHIFRERRDAARGDVTEAVVQESGRPHHLSPPPYHEPARRPSRGQISAFDVVGAPAGRPLIIWQAALRTTVRAIPCLPSGTGQHREYGHTEPALKLRRPRPSGSRRPDKTTTFLNQTFKKISPCMTAGIQGRGKRDIPEKIRRPAASSGTITTCENPGVTRTGVEPGPPWWEASSLTAQLPRPHLRQQKNLCQLLVVKATTLQKVIKLNSERSGNSGFAMNDFTADRQTTTATHSRSCLQIKNNRNKQIPVEIGIAFAAISSAPITMAYVGGGRRVALFHRYREEFRRIVPLHSAENPLAVNFTSFAVLAFAQLRLVDLDRFARPADQFPGHQHPVYAHLAAETRPGDDRLSRAQKFVHYSLLSRVFDQAPE
ncbi:hypothetical protein PR048_014547 [Dryococelus australis]|uniref:Uncharacterized protein n=1 Tax=Dryococelus australis TaxID=614101 RepID=A0ABQ9HEJ5_9NEOP|nr:hypothetical protein PR048_014547 [Dryococelus australis]